MGDLGVCLLYSSGSMFRLLRGVLQVFQGLGMSSGSEALELWRNEDRLDVVYQSIRRSCWAMLKAQTPKLHARHAQALDRVRAC